MANMVSTIEVQFSHKKTMYNLNISLIFGLKFGYDEC